MFTSVIQVILILWFVIPSESDVCSQDICQCTKFGRTQLIVKCRVHGYISAGIPSNTLELDLSSCSLSSITEDIFRNLTVLEKLDLSKNSLRHIPQNTFRNMKKLEIMKISDNLLSIADIKVVLKGLTRLHRLHLDRNPLGPSLPSDIFTGFENMTYLSMIGCNLQKIENGSFRAMRHLQVLDLSSNKLTHIHKGTVQGLTDQLSVLYLQGNELETIGDGTLNQFKNLQRCRLDNNKLTSVPDLTGPKTLSSLNLQENQITDLSSIATSGIGHVYNLLLSNNRIDHLPPNIFHNTLVIGSLDLSFNKLKSLPDEIFNGLDQLKILVLTFNNITHINRRTFSGLSSLTTLLLIKNKLTFIAKDVFDETPSLKSLFLHSNAITNIEKETFERLDLSQLTIFDNPLNSLPDGIFDGMANGTQVALTCKNLRQLPLGKYVSKIECAPTTSLHVILDNDQSSFSSCFTSSGFVCHDCTSREKHSAPIYCANCSLCPVGTYSCTDGSRCLPCPAGNGILHVKSIWRYVTFKPIRCFRFLRQGVSRLKNRVVARTGTSDELSHLIEESN